MSLSELTLEITQRCPNRCLYCSSLVTAQAPHLPLEQIENIIQQVNELGLRRIYISGGEPLVHPELERIITCLEGHNIDAILYTSGITSIRTAYIWHQWNKRHTVIFNIQSTNPIVHDALFSQSGSYALSMQSLHAAISLNIPTEVHIVPNKFNLSTLEKTVTDLYAYGIKRISFLKLVVQGYARQNAVQLQMGNAEWQQFFSIGHDLKQRYPQTRFGTPFISLAKESHCTAGREKLVIRYDGKILPCEAFKDRDEFIMGDSKTDSLSAVLESASHNPALSFLHEHTVDVCQAQ